MAAAVESAKSRRARRADPPPQFSDPEQAGESASPHRLFCAPGRAHFLGGVSPLYTRHGEMLAAPQGPPGRCTGDSDAQSPTCVPNRVKSTTVLRASFGQVFKAPLLYQLYSNHGNRTLQPETANSWATFKATEQLSIKSHPARVCSEADGAAVRGTWANYLPGRQVSAHAAGE